MVCYRGRVTRTIDWLSVLYTKSPTPTRHGLAKGCMVALCTTADIPLTIIGAGGGRCVTRYHIYPNNRVCRGGRGANQPRTTWCKNIFLSLFIILALFVSHAPSADFGAHFICFNSSPKNQFGERSALLLIQIVLVRRNPPVSLLRCGLFAKKGTP